MLTAALPTSADVPTKVGPVTYGQERRLLFEEIMHGAGHSLTTHFPVVFRFIEAPDQQALQTALSQLCDRHDALRTVFVPSAARSGRHLFVNMFARTSLFVPGSYEQHVVAVARPILTMTRLPSDGLASAVREELQRGLDYTHAPLFRAVLGRDDKGDSYLILIVSHLIVDGLGVRLLGSELNRLYASLVAGRECPVVADHLTPIEFAKLEHRRSREPCALELARYWQTHWGLDGSGCVRHSEIPFATSRERASEAACRVTECPPAMIRHLRTIVRRDAVTEYAVFRMVMVMLFHRYTKRNRMGLWANFANRRQPGAAGMVGWCHTSHLIATQIESATTVTDLLRQTARVLAEGQYHEWLPLQAASHLVGCNIEKWHTRLGVHYWHLGEGGPNVLLERVRVDVPIRGNDLSIRLRRQGHTADVVINYDASRYDPSGLDQLVADTVAAFEVVASRPHTSVDAQQISTAVRV